MQAALEIALARASEQGAEHIHRIRLRVGLLSGVVPEALRFAFDVVVRDTMAEGACLDIEEVPVVCFCPSCQREFSTTGWFFECPSCGQASADVRQGAELELVSLEVS
jgi:hydrogenase nickel incorporation protein HypA/HybF